MRTVFLLYAAFCLPAICQNSQSIQCIVKDPSGAVVPHAQVLVHSAQGSVVSSGFTDSGGEFPIVNLPTGSYAVEVQAPGFVNGLSPVTMPPVTAAPLLVRLNIAGTESEITVTTTRGAVEGVEESLGFVISRGRERVMDRPLPTIGQALEGAPGVTVQQTTYGSASPILRGLTGYQTLLLVDGIRFNTSIFRSGPNQYIALVDRNAADRVEVTLGPSGAAEGSDSMGGTINILTSRPGFRDHSGVATRGELSLAGGSADLSGTSGGRVNFEGRRLAGSVGGSLARHNDLRAGRGDDSRNVYRRYFGLDLQQMGAVFGSRLQNTGFLRYGSDAALSARLSPDQMINLRFLRSDMQNVRSYRDQFGGANRILAAFDPQNLNFASARYEKLRLGPLDSVSGTFSFNQQSDGFIQKNSLPTDIVTTDDSQVAAYGYTGQATAHTGSWQALVFGGEIYREYIYSTRFNFDPVARSTVQDRALYPNNSTYTTGGLFVHDTVELPSRRLRATFGARFTNVAYVTRAADNLDAAGKSLGVTDSRQSFRHGSFHAGLEWHATHFFTVSANAGQGFRAPNVNDLGTVGARTLGYDVTAADALAVNAILGVDSSDSAAPTGKKAAPLGPETLANYELGLRIQTSRWYARVHFFDSELRNPITSRTLLFPVGQAPASIGGASVTPLAQSAAQKAAGVVAVVTALSPRAVHTPVNDGKTRYFGTDVNLRYRVSAQWRVEASYSFLGGLDLNPVRPTRRLPPQSGEVRVRYTPTGRRPWLELAVLVSGPQLRLNGGDIDDDRIGASRRRSDIASFFKSATVSTFIALGPDGRPGTADDVFTPTSETLRQIQDRVLPLNAVINGVAVSGDGVRVPMYTKNAGWSAINLTGGYPVTDNLTMFLGLTNVADRNYRVIGSGTDAPGINTYAGLRFSF